MKWAFWKRKKKPSEVDVLFLVHGVPQRKIREPNYPTNPLDYGLNPFKPETDLASINWDQCRAFTESKDAINFAYDCNLDTAITLAYRRINGEWILDSKLGDRAYDIDW